MNKATVIDLSDRSVEEKIYDFSSILDTINEVDDKTKRLWKEIYENAIIDRKNAFAMFQLLVNIVEDKSTEHAVHSRALSSYIERMSKANDQLIRLAELISKARESEGVSSEDLFDAIGRK